ncbi:MAG: TolB-like 6-bladed beta-propeller domain-containing protein [Paramuribaculum sp.]|nr:TolB-like 6-bladed beta-propeller domain-containing protein [Paramuribaculum sp.]
MSNFKFSLVVGLMGIGLLSGCNSKSESSGMQVSETSYNLDEIKTVTVECHRDSLPVLVNIEDMYNYDNDLLVATNADTFAFYRFSLEDLSLKDRFGKRGQGPDESPYPNICVTKSPRPLYMIDSSRQRMYNMADKTDTVFIGYELMNQAREIDFPCIGYYRLNGRGCELCLLDIESGKLTDSLDISEKFPELKNSSIVWDANSNKAVVAFIKVDAILVLDISSGKISKCLIGKGSKPEGTIMFGQVQCMKNCFAVLNFSELESEGSQVIFFDYECNPIIAINPGIKVRRMMCDVKKRRVVMLGLEDDYIYSFQIPESIKI